jgi:hypothetical protein
MTDQHTSLSDQEKEPQVYPADATPWHELTYSRYRRALKQRQLVSGITLERPPVKGQPTAVCVHGWHGTPADFRQLGPCIRKSANLAFFLYDDRHRLASTAELLRRELRGLRGERLLIAFSMGALLPAYAGATDWGAELRGVVAFYLNPLLGGTRYADADPLLARLDQIPALQWLHSVKQLIHRLFFPPSVRDLDPRSSFQQAIFGAAGRPATFRDRTTIIWTEDDSSRYVSVFPHRVPTFFGCTHEELLQRLGDLAAIPPRGTRGHTAPIDEPGFILPLLEAVTRDCL